MWRSLIAGSIATIIASSVAHAILIRPDRDDARYLELAERYPASIGLDLPDGEGTLIAPRWILTAAHLARDVKLGPGSPGIPIAGKHYRVDRVIVHPDYTRAASGSDIALVRLAEAVTGIDPVPIYRGTTELGKIATLVGHGYSGTLDKGPVSKADGDGKKRAGTNRIDRIIRGVWLLVVVDPLDTATDLECAGGPGDSGGPAFIEEDGKLYVAGVSSFTDDTTADGIAGNYGDRQAFTRVSAFARWIDRVIAGY